MTGPAPALRRNRLDSLTGARFVAALLVFVFHIATEGFFAPGSGTANAMTFLTKSAGTIGVSFFFVLSGFVLTWSARPADTYAGFLRRRLVKIYPNHLVTFALAMLVFAAASTSTVRAVLNLLLLHAWVPDPQTFLSVNGPSWSLSCELLFYLLFPLLISLIGRIGDSRLWWLAGGVMLVILSLPGVAGLLPEQPEFGSVFTGTVLAGQPVYHLWFLYIFPPARLLDFVLGILVARLVLSGRWLPVRVGPAAALTVIAYFAGCLVSMPYTVDAVTVTPLALLIGALATRDSAGSGTRLGRPVMRHLGEISFAFYLIQEIVLALLSGLFGYGHLTALSGLLVSLLGLVLSIALASLLYFAVERPAVRRWGRSRSPVPRPERTPS